MFLGRELQTDAKFHSKAKLLCTRLRGEPTTLVLHTGDSLHNKQCTVVGNPVWEQKNPVAMKCLGCPGEGELLGRNRTAVVVTERCPLHRNP